MWGGWLTPLPVLNGRGFTVRAAVFALAACLASAAVWAEERNVYLIASEPIENVLQGFPTLLYRVEGGGLVKVRTVNTQRQKTEFVDVYPELGYAFVGSYLYGVGESLLLDVIDMDSVSTQRSYEIDVCGGCSFVGSYMQARRGALAYIFCGCAYTKGCSYKGVDLKSGRIVSGFEWIDEANAYRVGTGSSFVDRRKGFWAVMHGSEVLEYGDGSVRRHELGWSLPEGMVWEPGSTFTDLKVNNDDMRLVLVRRNGEWKGKLQGLGLYVFDKAAGEWSSLDIPVGMGSFRAFGHWLAREDIQTSRSRALDLEPLKAHWFPPFLSAAERFEMRRYAPTGRLFFYNVRTRELIVHETGEPDTEVLYVDGNDMAWYRVSDELRRAPILGERLGPPEVVARGPELWAVHWLFFGRE